jgi:hypothetical protein
LTRPSEEEWLRRILKKTARSHLCHLSICENPFHSVQEENASRKRCHTTATEAMADMTASSEAATFARGQCPHTPNCWLVRSLPSMTPSSMSLQICNRFQTIIKTARMCHMYRCDFPVHLRPSLPRSTPLYTKTSRASNLKLYYPQTYAYLTSQFTRPGEWFQAYYNHQIISHSSF